MECTAKILREKKVYKEGLNPHSYNAIKIYCPILGEIVLTGEEAERARKKIKEKDEAK